ncbi:transmembrane and immunoglobulin domain-containing protein 2 [Microcaecilia unicolor]|uniref:transmembrane and immunoglobulin domain-containing protein 2 n=1 Tax=Microcaecilia unicolor TaxID=1415580 RepID=UPI001184D493|nr:transmembrane and immunoglobulin domain-containing protein 2 [Microcaecilia unicolor]
MGWPGAPFLLLLCFLVLVEVSSTLKVIQNPPLIQAPLGNSVQMTCEIDFHQEAEKVKLEWIQEGNLSLYCKVSVYLQKSPNCCQNGSTNGNRVYCVWNSTRFLLKIDNVSKEDSGLFFCNVLREIPPPYIQQRGNGTILEVQEKNTEDPGSSGDAPFSTLPNEVSQTSPRYDPIIWPYIASVGTVVVILVAVVTWYCTHKWRKSSSSGAADPFYENVIRIRKQQAAKTSTPQERRQHSHYTIKPTHKCRHMEQRTKLEVGAPKAGMKRC